VHPWSRSVEERASDLAKQVHPGSIAGLSSAVTEAALTASGMTAMTGIAEPWVTLSLDARARESGLACSRWITGALNSAVVIIGAGFLQAVDPQHPRDLQADRRLFPSC
jgi:hypothetical protein